MDNENKSGAGEPSPASVCSTRDFGAEALEAAQELRAMAAQIICPANSPSKLKWIRWAVAIETVVKQNDAKALVLRHPLKVPLGGGPVASGATPAVIQTREAPGLRRNDVMCGSNKGSSVPPAVAGGG